MKRASLIAGLLALVGLLAPVPRAEAAQAVSATTVGTISLWSSWDCIPPSNLTDTRCADAGGTLPTAEPRNLFAHVSPGCSGLQCPPYPISQPVKWVFSASGNPYEPATCVTGSSLHGSGPCQVWARGTLINFGLGGTACGPSQVGGEINRLRFSIGAHSDELSGPPVAGHLLPYALLWRITKFSNSAGAGVATLSLLDAPDCGLNPLTGFQGEHSFQAQLSFAWGSP